MKIELNGIELDRDEEGGEGRSIKSITTEDTRNVESYDSPGTQGSSYNDHGRSAVRLAFEGTAAGKEARTLLEGIWSCFKKGDPVEFNSDISGAADITRVLIQNFVVASAAGDRDRYDYAIGLWEYKEPPEEPDIPGAGSEEGAASEEVELTEEQAAAEAAKEENAEKWAEEQARISNESVNELSGVVLNAEGKPAAGVTVIISGAGQELEVKTDEEGTYRAEKLEPGEYTIKVKEAGYEDVDETVSIG